MKRRGRSSRSPANCGEDLLEVNLNRFFPVESPRRFGLGEEDRCIVSEAPDEVCHIEFLECLEKALY
ncbi:MAG TPA: hypothetical protein VGY75_02845 [Candidatus Udaeobacter sp.]|jgi:hypothetical protein|nr:hypothetical protein [Candidatus Udaeobacter sp.]